MALSAPLSPSCLSIRKLSYYVHLSLCVYTLYKGRLGSVVEVNRQMPTLRLLFHYTLARKYYPSSEKKKKREKRKRKDLPSERYRGNSLCPDSIYFARETISMCNRVRVVRLVLKESARLSPNQKVLLV